MEKCYGCGRPEDNCCCITIDDQTCPHCLMHVRHCACRFIVPLSQVIKSIQKPIVKDKWLTLYLNTEFAVKTVPNVITIDFKNKKRI